jgi:NAD-dependent dihydropyrimidine dehydrogenase PreA subunit
MTPVIRKIVRIDEAKCDGCGDCLGSCAEGAIALVNGKARVSEDALCDGLGACIGHCPRGAITVIEREAAPFDEAQVRARVGAAAPAHDPPARPHLSVVPAAPRRGLSVVQGSAPAPAPAAVRGPGESQLGHWPVQIPLVNPAAPWLRGADLLVAADCVPFAFRRFHEALLAGRVVVVGCPKLDEIPRAAEKLEAIFRTAGVRSVTIARMEVPCCGGISAVTRRALAASGACAPVSEVVIRVDGTVRDG